LLVSVLVFFLSLYYTIFNLLCTFIEICYRLEYTHCHLFFPLNRSWLITGVVTRLTRRVSLVEQELLTHPEHMSSLPVFSGVRVTRSLVLCVFCWSLLVLLYFFFWPLCCLFFFDIRIPIAPLVSSNSSCQIYFHHIKYIFVCYHDNQKLNTSLYNIEINWLMKIKLCFNLYMHSIWCEQFRMFSTKEGSTSLILLTM